MLSGGNLISARTRRASPLLLLTLLCNVSLAFPQQKLETSQDTNERIRQLASALQARQGEYVIGSGDLLHVEVFDVAEMARDVRVSEAGFINVPPIPVRVRASGLTAFQLEEKLGELLQTNGLITHPQVSVTLKEQHSQPITLIGAVRRPLVYQAVRQTSLLELLSEAGGISDDAGSIVLITRSSNHAAREAEGTDGKESKDAKDAAAPETETITIQLSDLLDSGNAKFNIPLLGGDVVSIPRAGVVYVVGAVSRQGGFVLANDREQMSTLKILALAGGVSSTAKPNQAVILRRPTGGGPRKEVPVDLAKILARKGEDVTLYPNDILFVPDSSGKRALHRTGEAAIALASGVALFRLGR